MSPELITIISVGVALRPAWWWGGQRSLRSELGELRGEVGQLRERMALLEELRDAISGRHAA